MNQRFEANNLVISKSASPVGNWQIRISDSKVLIFKKYRDAINYIESLKKYDKLSGNMNLGDL